MQYVEEKKITITVHRSIILHGIIYSYIRQDETLRIMTLAILEIIY